MQVLSYDQIRELIYQKLGQGRWISELYPERVVYQDEPTGRYFQASYTISEEQEVSLGDREEVQRVVEYYALNFEVAQDGTVPEWVELVPAGPKVTGRDGRWWMNSDPEGVVKALNARGAALPVDYNHSTELKAPKGEESPAAGWLEEFQVRAGAIFGRVDWTESGLNAVKNREYRYLSPALLFDAEKNIRSLSSVALVNKANFSLPALNREGSHPEDGGKKMIKKILQALGLPENAAEATALNAIATLQSNLQTALNRAETPSLEKFVPRADYDAALNKANNFEQKLKEKETADLETAINAEIDAAVKAGKVTPATKEYYTGMCRQEGGLESFKKFVAAAPVIGDPSGLAGRDPDKGGGALNAEQKQIAGMFGNSEEDLKKYGSA